MDAKRICSASDDKTIKLVLIVSNRIQIENRNFFILSVVRIFDMDSGICISTIDFLSPPNSIDISQDGQASLLITHGKKVEIYDGNTYVNVSMIVNSIQLCFDIFRLNKLQSFEMPCEMNAASFHPTAREFVCGGLDFRIYKYNFETGV